MSKNDMVMVPVDLMESAIDAFGSIGMHDELDQLNEILGAPAQQHQGEPVYQLRNTVVGNVWRDADKEAYDSAESLAEYERRVLYTHANPAEVERLRAENERLKAGFYQQVTDADLKKIHDYVSDPDLPKGAFLRQDAYDLANFTAHMCREVQASRAQLAEAQALMRDIELTMDAQEDSVSLGYDIEVRMATILRPPASAELEVKK